ncbi:hypothetical protein E3N88_01480 [Mikania micrantha]|uniref:Protein kinase domain-containing protein n=1 Tax=Mikania micrantha TaxID=192012 RepID=A0A5N6Q129_9ASTR|nr:hypothetical protein E3N88_01480 [Mikania micrantha]
MEEGRLMSVFDPMVVNEDSMGVVLEIANLAMRCLNYNGKYRPTMKEVAMELEGMRMSYVPYRLLTRFGYTNHNAKSTSAETLNYAKKDCSDSCGDVKIPYPFGIGANCSVNKWYVVDCNSSKPYLSAFNNMEVLNVNLEEQMVTVNVSVISRCQNNSNQIPGIDLGDSPFVFSGSHNILTVEGCGYAAVMNDGRVITGCSTTCTNDTASVISDYCFGIGCCQVTIPYNLKSYSLDLIGLKRLGEDGSCGSAYLGDRRWLPGLVMLDNTPSDPKMKTTNTSFFPITFMWFLTNDDFLEIPNCWEDETIKSSLHLGNGSIIDQRKCSCGKGRVGNPYSHYQCEESEDCRRCRDTGRICRYELIYLGRFDGSWWLNCSEPTIYTPISRSRKSPLAGVIIGVGICMGLLFLPKFSYELHKLIKKTIAKKRKEKFFKRNGGLLLKQQEATKDGLVDKTILFTSKELEIATDHFNENRIIGRGGQGTVYKGMLADGRIVAIKKAKMVDESQLEQFINEVVILSQVNHRNVVQLLGCCLETEVPLLVSEFISKGTLYAYIQDDSSELAFSLNMRMQIASEEGHVMSIFDPMVVNEDSEGVILEIANLAMRCLNANGKHRPTMKEVAMVLEGITMSHVPSRVLTSFGHASHNEDLPMFTDDESTSTIVNFEESINE